MTSAARTTTSRPTDAELAARFHPVFARIAEGAAERERGRILPFEPIAWLREAGFGLLRVPAAYGGMGITMTQLFRLLIELGEADSNLPQALRGHMVFVEGRRRAPDVLSREYWFRMIADGALIGNAQAERGPETGTTATLTSNVDGSYALTGTKFYSTGTIFADWVLTAAKLDTGELVSVVVSTAEDGVERRDDWDGFGQRMTGSGTTVFDGARVEARNVINISDDEAHSHGSIAALFQTVLLAALAGIGRAVVRDAVAFVQPRTRTFNVPGASSPRNDPLVQRVVGRLSSLAFSAEALVLAVAVRLEAIDEALAAGTDTLELHTAAQIAAFQAQQVVLPTVLEAATLLFEVGGASATGSGLALDRHWRNARTIASHNPAGQREQALGDYELNGELPAAGWIKQTLARRAGG